MAYWTGSGGGGGGGGFGGRGGPPRGDRMANLGDGLQNVDWTKIDAPPVVWPKVRLADATLDRSEAEVEEWRNTHGITTTQDTPKPLLTFKECPFPSYVLDSFDRQGFKEPTAIQCQAWGVAMLNRDIVGIAKTGSGKTLAFLCPGIVHILAQDRLRRGDGPIMLVLAPTRELAKQIDDEVLKVTKGTEISTVCAYGGTSKFPQRAALRDGVHIAIGCPGRVIDLLSEGATNLHRVSYLVLDEADRMLDMGFEPQIRMICSQLRPERQTLMFSATWPREVQSLAQSYQKDFVRINVGSLDLQANKDVRQIIRVVPDFQKYDALMTILTEKEFRKCLIFVATKQMADDLCDRLRAKRYFSMAIHGDRTQQARDGALAQFRDARQAILVATDVAQRGLDIRNLDTVVNYDFPMMMEDYIHRVGRTGRAGAQGDAYSFVNEKQGRLVPELIDVLKRADAEIPPELHGLRGMGGGGPRRWGAPSGGRGGGFMMRGPPPRAPMSSMPPPPPSYDRYASAVPMKRERSPDRRRDSPPRRRDSPPRRRDSPPRRRDSPPRRLTRSPVRRDSRTPP
eukprot:PhM_4_TR10336/c2_g2_i1/m.75959/K12823/DDX5, DBP2; ATP-dependent RNA helicase DDX5/DBP2